MLMASLTTILLPTATNARVVACIGMFLRLNDIKFKPRHDELLRTVYGVADGTLGYEELVAWIEKQF